MAYLKADGAAADAFVQKAFAPQTDVYITLDLRIPAAHEAAMVGDLGYGPLFTELDKPGFPGFGDQGLLAWPDGPDVGLTLTYLTIFDVLGDPFTADVFHTVEMRVQNGSPITTSIWLDGVALSFVSASHNQPNPYEAARFGLIHSQPDARQVYDLDNIKIGTTRGGSEIFSEDFEGASPLDNFDIVSGDVSIVADAPIVLHGPATYEWRFVVTKLNLRVLTYLDRLARDRNVTYALNRPAVATGVVPSDNPEINIVQSDGFPMLDEGVRCLLGFRREGGDPPWVIRFAGIIEQLEDNADEDAGAAPFSTYTAYDPWQYLYRRPVREADGSLPGANGLTFSLPGNQIALALLARTFTEDGEHHIKITGGSVETTDVIDITFQQGSSVGEAWDQLCATGNIDIILTALYDPVGSPSKLATFNCYSLAGTTRHKAVMAWDKPSRSLVGINRLADGDQRANRVQYYYGQGGPKAGVVVSDFASVALFGDYWAQQFFPGKSGAAVELLAAEQLLLRARGMKTYKLNPVPGSLGQIDSPLVFLDYFLGDTVPIFASSRFRHSVAVGKRVIGIPIDIADDGQERIQELAVGEGEVDVEEGGGDSGGGGGPPPEGIIETLGCMNLTGSDYSGLDSGLRAELSVAIIGNADPDLSALAAEPTPLKLIYMDPMICSDPGVLISYGVDKNEAIALGVLARDGGGSYITGIASANYYLPELDRVAYRDRFVANVSAVLAANPGFGVYFDNVDIDYHNVYAATATRYPTNASWRAAYKTFLADVCARLRGAGYYVAGNARAFYSGDPGPTNTGELTKTWWNYLSAGGVSYFDNLMIEFWQMTPTVGTPVRISGHVNNVLQEWDNWQTLVALAHTLGADFGASQSPFGNVARDNQAALYTRASLLLVYDSTFLDSIQWRSATALPVSEPSYAFDVGAPTAAATTPQANVSRREFTGGIVIVNHSAGTITQDGHTLASGEAYIGV